MHLEDLPRCLVGFGSAGIGNLYRALDDATATATVDEAWRGGVRYFDTAPHYGLGLAERRLGAALADKPRESFMLSSKVGRLVVPRAVPERDDLANGFDVPGTLTRQWDPTEAGVRRSIEESLKRLGLNRLDIAYLHDPDAYDLEAGITQALPALLKLQREGLIDYIGVGTNSAAAAAECVRRSELDLVMIAGRYTLLEQTALEDLFPICQERGVGVINVGVYNSGLLARAQVPGDAHYNYVQASPEVVSRARMLAETCARWGTDLPTAALHFSRRNPVIKAVVVGASGPRQMRENLERSQAEVPEGLWRELRWQGLIPADS